VRANGWAVDAKGLAHICHYALECVPVFRANWDGKLDLGEELKAPVRKYAIYANEALPAALGDGYLVSVVRDLHLVGSNAALSRRAADKQE